MFSLSSSDNIRAPSSTRTFSHMWNGKSRPSHSEADINRGKLNSVCRNTNQSAPLVLQSEQRQSWRPIMLEPQFRCSTNVGIYFSLLHCITLWINITNVPFISVGISFVSMHIHVFVVTTFSHFQLEGREVSMSEC